MKRTKSRDPAKRLGVFKRFAEVPNHHRLEQYTDRYRGSQTWQTFCETHEYDNGSSQHFWTEVDRVGDSWCSFMASREPHHALARPEDVEAWSTEILEARSDRRAYDYWLRVRRFYDWLLWHPDHPHVYNPVLLAVIKGEATQRIWGTKLERWDNARENYEEKK